MSKEGEDRRLLVFRGTDATEAEEFVAHIYQVAQREGRIRDDAWIADFAVACFIGDALRWYDELEPEVQNDWRLLKRAILQKYPPDSLSRSIESWDQDPTIPTPAAAVPPPKPYFPIDVCYYRLRVFFDDKASSYMLGTGGTRSLFLTKRIEDSLVVFWSSYGRLMAVEQGVETTCTIALFWYTSPKKPAPNSLLEYEIFAFFLSKTEWLDFSVAEVFKTDSKGRVPDLPGCAGTLPAPRWELDDRGYLKYSYPELKQTVTPPQPPTTLSWQGLARKATKQTIAPPRPPKTLSRWLGLARKATKQNIAPPQPPTTLSPQGLARNATQVQFYTQPGGDERAWIRATFSEGALRYKVKSNQIFVG
ncbi:hypothetical protein FRC00_001011 [Tulasnella sp. 408]|nr:hypothetical protein FRC00_001011 [Tulasnella sp. 408]